MLWLACVAQFMVVLDVSVVNVALPSIQRGLGFTDVGLQWVVAGYALVFAGFLLLGGRLADLYGRRRVFLWGLGAVLRRQSRRRTRHHAGTADRDALGAGPRSGCSRPATLTLLTAAHAEGPVLTRALATWAAVSSAGRAAGNVIGGVLTESLSWRWTLLINVPVGALAALAAVRLLPVDRTEAREARLDVPGAVLATAGVTAFVYGLTEAQHYGWGSPATLVPLAGAVSALLAFALVEARYASAPVVPPRLVRSRAIWAGNLVMLLAGACFIPMWYFLSLYMQHVLHYGALATGIGFLPHTLAGIAGARLAPAVMCWCGPRALIITSALLSAAGFLWQSQTGADAGYLEGLLGPAIVMSAGMGLLITPITTLVTSGVPAREAGAASGLMNATRQIGGAIGLAALVTLAATVRGTMSASRRCSRRSRSCARSLRLRPVCFLPRRTLPRTTETGTRLCKAAPVWSPAPDSGSRRAAGIRSAFCPGGLRRRCVQGARTDAAPGRHGGRRQHDSVQEDQLEHCTPTPRSHWPPWAKFKIRDA
ncbi:putative drug resistance efflux protein [Streptomyces sp. GBA 94-10 4N24]|nr:putative drug resistance efflux protein [Streptomyces sp. GBA 94-10 4N24]ESQ02100.1 putative drug resistance efflux protein [Streptomyces sp. PVA_94-07]UZN62808.1 putative drug resistance efflux protein [Streptomyces sp. GBA 94-10 4N24]